MENFNKIPSRISKTRFATRSEFINNQFAGSQKKDTTDKVILPGFDFETAATPVKKILIGRLKTKQFTQVLSASKGLRNK